MLPSKAVVRLIVVTHLVYSSMHHPHTLTHSHTYRRSFPIPRVTLWRTVVPWCGHRQTERLHEDNQHTFVLTAAVVILYSFATCLH